MLVGMWLARSCGTPPEHYFLYVIFVVSGNHTQWIGQTASQMGKTFMKELFTKTVSVIHVCDRQVLSETKQHNLQLLMQNKSLFGL